MGGRYSCRFCGETRLTYDEFVVRHGTDPEWMKMLESHYFESDLRNALAGDPSGFRELTLRAPDHKAQPQIMQALWMAGIPVRPHRNSIKQIWKIESSLFVRAFGADLDAPRCRFQRRAATGRIRCVAWRLRVFRANGLRAVLDALLMSCAGPSRPN